MEEMVEPSNGSVGDGGEAAPPVERSGVAATLISQELKNDEKMETLFQIFN